MPKDCCTMRPSPSAWTMQDDTGTTASSTTSIWYIWTDDCTTASSDTTWTSWTYLNDTSSHYACTDTAVAWTRWASAATTFTYGRPSQEQVEAQEKIQKENRERKAAANARAERLLREHLDPKQLTDYDKHGCFYVVAPSGRRYRISKGRSGNVEQVSIFGRRIRKLCAHPIDLVPNGDTLLSQKLMLEYQEEEFLKIANVHVGSPVRRLGELSCKVKHRRLGSLVEV